MRASGPYFRLYAESAVIQALMTLRGIPTNKALAAKAGVPLETTRRFTSGQMVDVVGSNADKLAEALGVKAGFLFIERRSSLDMEDLAA